MGEVVSNEESGTEVHYFDSVESAHEFAFAALTRWKKPSGAALGTRWFGVQVALKDGNNLLAKSDPETSIGD
jgi:hypothetical protein